MKKTIIALSLTTSLFAGLAYADTEATTDALGHATKSVGHEIAAKTDDAKASINESLNDKSAAAKNKKSAFDHRVKSNIEDVKADRDELKSKILDSQEEKEDK